jgi:hypothetical protein
MGRNHKLEAELLHRTGGPAGFADQVLARIGHSEAKGNRGWEKSADEILAEGQEECADIPGWLIGAALKMPDSYLPELIVPMSFGAAAWGRVQRVRELLARGGAALDPAPPTYTCDECKGRHEGKSAMVTRRGNRVPICDECLLQRMPSREDLERFWLQTMKET